MQLMVVIAATSFYDVAELSGRLSISMTILLTLAAFTSSKPTPIAASEATTYHDRAEKVSLLLVVLMCLSNVISTMMCGGEDDETPAFLQELYQRHAEHCILGWCGSREVDCNFIIGFMIVFLPTGPLTLMWYYCDFCFRMHKKNAKLQIQAHLEEKETECGANWVQRVPFTRSLSRFRSRQLTPMLCRVWCRCNGLKPHLPCQYPQSATEMGDQRRVGVQNSDPFSS